MIDAHHVDPEFAHLGEVTARLLLRAKIITAASGLNGP